MTGAAQGFFDAFKSRRGRRVRLNRDSYLNWFVRSILILGTCVQTLKTYSLKEITLKHAHFNISSPVALNSHTGRVEEQRVGRVTIFKTTKSPKWYMQWNEDGRQYRPSLRTTSKKQALHLAKNKDAKLTLGVVSTARVKAITIPNAVEKYLEVSETPCLRTVHAHLQPQSQAIRGLL